MLPDPLTLDPSDPVPFTEAISYFRKQAPWISGSSWGEMARLSLAKGDQVSGASLLRMVDDVWSRMDRAMVEGLPYSEFVRDMGRDMGRYWRGLDSSRLRLIYQNNVGSALMAGRMAQVLDPDVVADRPFLLFDAIEDMRTSPICLERDGVILPASDPFWKSNTPLLHHSCRSSVISLDGEDVADEGGVTGRDKVRAFQNPAQKGWGGEHSWADWKPRGEDYHPALWDQYTRWKESQAYDHTLTEWRNSLLDSWGKALGLPGIHAPVSLVPPPGVAPELRGGTPARVVPPVKTPAPVDHTPQIRKLLDQWVLGSKRKTSVVFKKAAIQEFALPGEAYSRVNWKITERDVEGTRPAVRQIYQDTQAALRERYPQGTVTLYRGVKTEYAIQGAIESWTTDIPTAQGFDGYTVIAQEFPIAQVLAFSGGPHWKNGKYGEQHEFMVLSEPPKG